MARALMINAAFKLSTQRRESTRGWVCVEVYSGYGACLNRIHWGMLHTRFGKVTVSSLLRDGFGCLVSNMYCHVFVCFLTNAVFKPLTTKRDVTHELHEHRL